MPKVTEAIQNFLRARRDQHNGPDMLDRWNPFIETQVNVSASGGEPVAGKRNTFTDGIFEFHSIRIPKNANSEPEFRDYELKWPLDPFVEGIGSTGWDWSARRSRWFGYDFDSLVSHAAGIGITDAELEKVRQAAQAIPYVEVRRSTGGGGLHLYVYLDEIAVPTANHTEHAALARAVLGMMSSETGFDFARQIDVCGGNMWMWHRKMSHENGGLSLMKAAERTLAASDIPANWRDHIDVVTRRRTKVRIGAVADEHLDPFEALASSRSHVPLDETHKRIIDELTRSGFSTIWVPDHHLLQTHTKALQDLMESPTLKLQGVFKTNSTGKNPGSPNCFAFPLDKGGWRVYRFSQGVNEAETWTQDGEGWTTCFFNRKPDLATAAKAMGGIERANCGGFVFDTARKAMEAATTIGQSIPLPAKMEDREAILKRNKDGRLLVEIQKRDGDEGMTGWEAKKNYWSHVFDARTENKREETSFDQYDKVVRPLISPSGERAGWMMLDKQPKWIRVPREEAKLHLMSTGLPKQEAEIVLASLVGHGWNLVNLPFQPEFPGCRQWNYDAAQYRFDPANLSDDEIPNHPHWDKILSHCGHELTPALRAMDWATQANVLHGGHYLLYWIACCLREPFSPLPYLFLYGNQASGKSILHEAIALLMTKGVTCADRALTNPNEMNGELASAVLCYIEEKDLSNAGPTAYNRLKSWVTGLEISIRKMRTDSYTQPNTTHWIQCANDRNACVIKPGDTRITMMHVRDLQPGEEIPKRLLIDRLIAEAPHFMRTIVDLQLPPVEGRLRIPVVSTDSKQQAEDANRDPVEQFILEKCFEVPGHCVLFSELYDRFLEWVEGDQRYEWTKVRFSKSLPHHLPAGLYTGNHKCVGNLAFESAEPACRFFSHKGRLKREQE